MRWVRIWSQILPISSNFHFIDISKNLLFWLFVPVRKYCKIWNALFMAKQYMKSMCFFTQISKKMLKKLYRWYYSNYWGEYTKIWCKIWYFLYYLFARRKNSIENKNMYAFCSHLNGLSNGEIKQKNIFLVIA